MAGRFPRVLRSAASLAALTYAAAAAAQQPAADAGEAVFKGKGNCAACHGANGTGTPIGPSLADSTWVHVDGSYEQIRALIAKGVAQPKQFPAPMPPNGGGQLTEEELTAVAKYVVGLSRK